MSSPETYTCNVDCSNCDFSSIVDIPKGELITDALRVKECPTCGCRTLRKHNSSLIGIKTTPFDSPYNPIPLPKKIKPMFPDIIPSKPYKSPYYIHPDFKHKRYRYHDFKIQCSSSKIPLMQYCLN